MVTVFYYHVSRKKEYSKDFEEPHDALNFYTKTKNIKDKQKQRVYIVSYICNTSYEMNVMERIYK